MNVLVVFDHPRRNSFTGAVLDSVLAGLAEAGHGAEVADLRAEGFDPRLPEGDEPDWSDAGKRYSEEVMAEMARVERNDALCFVFPVWWWSVPATTKGWIDRVWNYGWAYGTRKLPHRRALLLAPASASEEAYRKRGYDTAIRTQVLVGIMDYCGIPESRLEILHDVDAGPDVRAGHLETARTLAATFFSEG